MIEVQCTSCHTRYRIDERVLPEGLPTFKCSRCGHVFNFEPRKSRTNGAPATPDATPQPAVDGSSKSTGIGLNTPDAEVSAPDISQGAAAGASSPAPEAFTSQTSGAAISSNAKPSVRQESDSLKEAEYKRRFQPDWQDPDDQVPEKADWPQANEEPVPGLSPQLKAKQAERFYSRVFTGKDPDAASGENLSFDFADEEPALDQARLARRTRDSGVSRETIRESARWQVGDEDSIAEIGALDETHLQDNEATGRRSRARLRAEEPQPRFTRGGFEGEERAPVYNRAITHSARFLMLLLCLIGVGFGAMTLLIHSAPRQAAGLLSSLPMIGDRFIQPATPAKLVALRDVTAAYQQSKEGRKALLISGTAENVSTESLRLVQLTAAIHDAQGHPLASQAVYCGNNVSAGMVGQMTPHEIEFFQKLEPAKTFALEPSASCRFVAIFMNPPGTARNYDVAVSQAVAGVAQAAQDQAP